MKFRQLVTALTAVALVGAAGVARGSIVERVVAVVGERPVLLSELRHRARPFLYRIVAQTQNQAQQAAQETEMFRELLNRMIDDRLEEQAADKGHLSVSPEEVDNALRNIAGAAKIGVRDLLAEAKHQGLTEQDYRDEIRRQVLEGKLVQLRVRGRVRVTEQDARASYGHWLKETGEQSVAEVRIIAMRIPAGATSEVIRARELLAQDVIRRARSGEDYCKLVKEFSDDQSTLETCGSRGPLPLEALVVPVRDVIKTMKEGQIADPIRYGPTQQEQVMLVVQLAKAPRVPTYEDVKDQMTDRAFGEAMERQRKLWLQELRRGVYVDVRL